MQNGRDTPSLTHSSSLLGLVNGRRALEDLGLLGRSVGEELDSEERRQLGVWADGRISGNGSVPGGGC